MVEYSRMASGLLVRLRKEMNGAVVGDMEARGLHYRRNYGVSLHTVRHAAREYAPDHGFAKYLWRQPVRELKLAAAAIADPGEISAEELGFWFEGVENSELAENLASFLLSRSGLVGHILETYTRSDSPLVVYTALLAAVKGYPQGLTADEVVRAADSIAADDPFVVRAAGLLLSRAGGENAENRKAVLKYKEKLGDSANGMHRRIASEIMI